MARPTSMKSLIARANLVFALIAINEYPPLRSGELYSPAMNIIGMASGEHKVRPDIDEYHRIVQANLVFAPQ